jgi:hypothetical protein
MKRLSSTSVLTLALVACGGPEMNDSASGEDSAAVEPPGEARETDSETETASELPDGNEPAVIDVANRDEANALPELDVVSEPSPTQEQAGSFEAFNYRACDGSAVDEVTVVDSDITESQEWSGVVHVQGEVTAAADAIVTIAPGTHVVMGAGSQLDFDSSAEAALHAIGTQHEPIHFCGEQPEVGSWHGLALGGLAEGESHLEHVVIAHGGDADGFALTLNSAALLRDVVVTQSAGGGVKAVDFSDDCEDVSIEGNAGVAAVLASDAALAHFPQGAEISANGDDSVHLRFAEIALDATLHAIGVAYVQEQDLYVTNGAVFTLEAGVDYLMGPGAELAVGAEGELATALFLGTEENPVTIHGTTEASGAWQGISIGAGASAPSTLRHVEILHAGADAHAALDLESQITIDHVTVGDSHTGVYIGAEGLSDASQSLTVSGVLGAPIHLAANALVSLPDCEFSDNGESVIIVEPGAISSSGVVADVGLPYAVLGDLSTTEAATVTIEAGVQFLMAEDSHFAIGADGSEATIVAQGESDAMIRFHGAHAGAGVWQGIVVHGNVTAESSFDFVEIRDAGGGSRAAALTLESGIEVTNSSFVASDGCGILKESSDGSDYTSANTFLDVEVAVATSAEVLLP